jgi:hypothetical protein
MEPFRWMLVAAVLLCSWVFVSPWFVEDAAVSPASWNFHISGGLALLFVMLGLMRSDDVPAYGLVAIGVWLVISPWVLDLPSLPTKQTFMYGAVLAGLGWLSRPSHQPKAAAH